MEPPDSGGSDARDEGEGMTDAEWNALEVEYRMLRQEIQGSIQNQVRILGYGGTALSVVLGVGLVEESELVVATLPVLAFFFFVLWNVEQTRMMRTGDYLWGVEQQIEHRGDGKSILWESWLRNRNGKNGEAGEDEDDQTTAGTNEGMAAADESGREGAVEMDGGTSTSAAGEDDAGEESADEGQPLVGFLSRRTARDVYGLHYQSQLFVQGVFVLVILGGIASVWVWPPTVNDTPVGLTVQLLVTAIYTVFVFLAAYLLWGTLEHDVDGEILRFRELPKSPLDDD